MNRRSVAFLLIALAVLAAGAPAQAATSSLGIAGDYNTFIFNDFKGSSDTQGRLAAGGNVLLDHYSVGDQLPSSNTGSVLVVGGDLNVTGGRVYHGDIQVGGTATMPGYDVQDGTLHTGTQMPFSFSAQADYLTRLSSSLSRLDATGRADNPWGGISLTGPDAALQVFNLNGNELLESWGLDLSNAAQDATIVINVSGEQAGLVNMNMDSLAAFSSHVLFNFYEATLLDLHSVGIWGSILAPLADVAGANGVIHGTLIASSFDGSMQQNLNPFTGTLPSPTPIPGAFVLLGTGLAGLAAIRRIRN